MTKYIDADAVAKTAAYRGAKPMTGVVPTTPQPAYNLPRATGLLNPGDPNPVLTVAPTPANLRASLFQR